MWIKNAHNRNLFNRDHSRMPALQAVAEKFPKTAEFADLRNALDEIERVLGIPSGIDGVRVRGGRLGYVEDLLKCGYKIKVPLKKIGHRTTETFVKKDHSGILTELRILKSQYSVVDIGSFRILDVRQLDKLTKKYRVETRKAIVAGTARRGEPQEEKKRETHFKCLLKIARLEVTHSDFLSMLMTLDRDSLPTRLLYDVRVDQFSGPKRISLARGYESIAKFIAARDEAWGLSRLDARGAGRGTRLLAHIRPEIERLIRKGMNDTRIVTKLLGDLDPDSARKNVARIRAALGYHRKK